MVVPVPPPPPRFQRMMPTPSSPPSGEDTVPIRRPSGASAVPTAPEKSTAKPTVAAEVVIRTMQDDMEERRAEKYASLAAPAAGPLPVAVTSQPSSAATKSSGADKTAPATAARVFPLPPQHMSKQQKVVMAPPQRRRRSRWPYVVLAGGVLVLVVAGGVGAWFWRDKLPLTKPVEALPAEQVLPGQASLIVRFRLSAAEARSQVASAWGESADAPTLRSLAAGDPRLLFTDSDIQDFYYVILEDDIRPYVVVPKTAKMAELLAGTAEVRYQEKAGWYIIHSLQTEPYDAALAQYTLASLGDGAQLTSAGGEMPLTLLLGSGVLPKLRTDIAGESFLAGQLQDMVLDATFMGQSRALKLRGSAQYLSTPTPGVASPELFTLIPHDVSLVRLGANFEEDVEGWQAVAGVVDGKALEPPAVQQLLGSLTTPYAYFAYTAAGVTDSVGLVISVPAEVRKTLVLGDPALEQGIQALIPLIVDRRTVAPVVFSEGTHAGIPLRYANVVGTRKALDYALTDSYLLIATSKEAMFSLLETVAGQRDALTKGSAWHGLLSAWGAVPAGRSVVVGTLRLPVLTQLLPSSSASQGLPFGLASEAASDGSTVASGIVLLKNDAAGDTVVVGSPTPVATPSPTPDFFVGPPAQQSPSATP